MKQPTADVVITNLLGQRVHSSSHPLATGSNTFTIPATLPTGLHMVLVTVGGKALHTQKINVVDTIPPKQAIPAVAGVAFHI